MEEITLSSKQRNMLQAWERFCEDETGAIPATMAAMKLGITTAAVYQAAERGWLKFFRVGRSRWYGRKSLYRYIEKRRLGGNWDFYRADGPQDCTESGASSFVPACQVRK